MENNMTICSCIVCKKEYSNKGIYTHYDRTHLGKTQYSSGNNGKYAILSNNAKLKKQSKIVEYLKNPTKCINCDNVLEFESKNNKFCSKSCSSSYTNKTRKHTLETRKKIAERLSGRKYIETHIVEIECNECRKVFEQEIKGTSPRLKTFCSKSCSARYTYKIRNGNIDTASLNYYRSLSNFKFNLKDYPLEFDFTLIQEHGWYKPKNHGDNLNGVSRDHMVSVKYGFENNIDPTIISHPANCRLILHNDNVSKGASNHITYEELLIRIDEWNNKYKFKS